MESNFLKKNFIFLGLAILSISSTRAGEGVVKAKTNAISLSCEVAVAPENRPIGSKFILYILCYIKNVGINDVTVPTAGGYRYSAGTGNSLTCIANWDFEKSPTGALIVPSEAKLMSVCLHPGETTQVIWMERGWHYLELANLNVEYAVEKRYGERLDLWSGKIHREHLDVVHVPFDWMMSRPEAGEMQ